MILLSFWRKLIEIKKCHMKEDKYKIVIEYKTQLKN